MSKELNTAIKLEYLLKKFKPSIDRQDAIRKNPYNYIEEALFYYCTDNQSKKGNINGLLNYYEKYKDNSIDELYELNFNFDELFEDLNNLLK